MVKTVLSYNNTLRALTLLLLSVCALHGAWAEDKLPLRQTSARKNVT